MHLQRMPVLAGLLMSFVVCRGQNASQSAPTNTSMFPPFSPTDAPMLELSSDEQFSFYIQEVLALANNGGAATGEVLRIAVGMIPHDFESVYNAFLPMADAILQKANSAMANNDAVSARQAYFRAASYYRGADFFLIGNQTDPRNYILWDQQLDAFNNATSLMDIYVETFSVKAHSPNVPGGEFEAIGRFFKAPGATIRTPTLLVGSGYDGSQEESYHAIGVETLKHGYNFVTYEGPGQPTVRRQQSIGFIPDWYNVVTPVVDYLANRSDVDMDKLALMGISYGGTLAPIGASRERRIKQVIADDGLIDLQQLTNEAWPAQLIDLYKNGSVNEFNKYFHAAQVDTKLPSSFRWFLDQSLFAFNTTNPYDMYERLGNITMSPSVTANLTQSVLVLKGQDDTSTGNQPQEAYQQLMSGRPNGKQLTEYYEFKTVLGAGEHTELGAEAQVAQVVLEWLKGKWDNVTVTL